MLNEPATSPFRFEPFGKRVDTLCAYSMQTTGKLVSPLAELTTGMQIGEHELDSRNLKLGMNIDRDSATVISDRNRTIDVDGYFNFRTKAGQMLIDRVIKNLKNAMVQSSFVRITYIHSRPLPDGV